jgi:hypothetical protein
VVKIIIFASITLTMQRALPVILFATLIFSACTQRLVCPAYQSAYIYDQDALRKKFSYLNEDSTPKVYSASKTKYLIAERTTYHKKLRALKTVPMQGVNVAVPDSLSPDFDENLGKLGADGEDGVVPGAELDLAARSVIDSTFIVDVPVAEEAPKEDSVYVISKDRELRLLKYNFPDSLKFDSLSGKYVSETPYYAVVNITFNVEQDNYMWYLKDYLVLPDVKLSKNKGKGDEAGEEGAAGTKGKKKQKGVKGFFKNLFKKKKKEEPVEEAPPPRPKTEEEGFDYIEEDEQGKAPEAEAPPEEEKKKGLFGRKKKDKKPKEEKPPEKEEEEPAEDTPVDPAAVPIPEKVEDGF